MKVLLTLMLAVFTVQVSSETNTDVMESFISVLRTIHLNIQQIQARSHGVSDAINRRYSTTLVRVRGQLVDDQREARKNLTEKRQEILKELNLSPSNPKVEICTKFNNDAMEDIVMRSKGGLETCTNMNNNQYNAAVTELKEIFAKEEEEHNVLVYYQKQCNSTSDSPAQLKNCMYYQLFTLRTDSVKELDKESQNVIKNYDSVLGKIEAEMVECSHVVTENIKSEIDQIVIYFKYCCAG